MPVVGFVHGGSTPLTERAFDLGGSCCACGQARYRQKKPIQDDDDLALMRRLDELFLAHPFSRLVADDGDGAWCRTVAHDAVCHELLHPIALRILPCAMLSSENCDTFKPITHSRRRPRWRSCACRTTPGTRNTTSRRTVPRRRGPKKIFNKLMNKGYVGGKRMADGSLEKIHRFDPTAEEIFVHRQLVGG